MQKYIAFNLKVYYYINFFNLNQDLLLDMINILSGLLTLSVKTGYLKLFRIKKKNFKAT